MGVKIPPPIATLSGTALVYAARHIFESIYRLPSSFVRYFFGSWTNVPIAGEYANATFVPCNTGDILTEALARIS